MTSQGFLRSATYLGSLLLIFLTLEVTARNFQYEEPPIFDAVLGRYIHKPGSTIRSTVEGNGTSHWGPHGIRLSPGDPNEMGPVVLVLGDSITEATQVNDEQTYTYQLSQHLGGVRVLNAGFAGTSAADYFALASAYQDLFHPDIVILELRNDDFSDAFAPVSRDKAFFRLKQTFDGDLQSLPDQLTPELPSLPRNLVGRSGCLSLLFRNVRRLWQQENTEQAKAGAIDPLPSSNTISLCLKKLAEAYHGKAVFFYIPPFDPSREIPQNVVEECLSSLGPDLTVIDLRDCYGYFRTNLSSPFGFSNSRFNFGHLNPAGHRAAAEALGLKIRRAGLIP